MASEMIGLCVDYAFSGKAMERFGITAALVLNRIMISINSHITNEDKYHARYFFDGQWWMDDSYKSISKFFRGEISPSSVRDSVRKLEVAGLLRSCQMSSDKGNMAKWYSIDLAIWSDAATWKKQTAQGKQADHEAENHPPPINNFCAPQSTISVLPHETISVPSLSNSQSPNSPSDSLSHDTIEIFGKEIPPQPSVGVTHLPTKFSQDECVLAQRWLDYLATKFAPRKAWNVEAFARGIAKAKRVMKISQGGMEEIFDFITTDRFWSTKGIQSPCQLLAKSDNGLRKIENIMQSMRGSKRYKTAVANDVIMSCSDEMLALAKSKGLM